MCWVHGKVHIGRQSPSSPLNQVDSSAGYDVWPTYLRTPEGITLPYMRDYTEKTVYSPFHKTKVPRTGKAMQRWKISCINRRIMALGNFTIGGEVKILSCWSEKFHSDPGRFWYWIFQYTFAVNITCQQHTVQYGWLTVVWLACGLCVIIIFL